MCGELACALWEIVTSVFVVEVDGCTGMVALANGIDVVGCASVEGPVISSEVARRSWDMLSGRRAHISADCS